MISLNTAKIETKIVLKWGGIFLFIIFLFFMLIKILPFVINIFAPSPPPEAAFGKLPPIPYPNQVKENLSYSLDILTSILPNFSDQAKVYKIIPAPLELTGLETTLKKVSKIGFNSDGTQITEDTYQWIDQPATSPERKAR